MPLTDLTNTTWKFNDLVDYSYFGWDGTSYQSKGYSVKFNSNGSIYSRLAPSTKGNGVFYVYYGYTSMYQSSLSVPWKNYLNSVITFTGGTAVTDPTLIAWLESTAERIYTRYKVDEPDLTAIADAIRSKGGTTDPLTFPDGFIDAINAL